MACLLRHLLPRLLGVLLAGSPALALAPANPSEDAEETAVEALRESRPEAVRPDCGDAGVPAAVHPPTSAAARRPPPARRPELFGVGVRTRLRC